MKITDATIRTISTPAENRLVVGLPQPGKREFVILELATDEGLTGVGLTFFGGALTPALHSAVRSFAELVAGEDPTRLEAIAAKMRAAAGACGPGGIAMLAMSAIDIACWDLMGKAAGKSVAQILGPLRDRVPCYASGALLRGYPLDYLAEAGPRLVGMGFRQMKMQCGAEATVSESIERVRVLRQGIGPDVDLMCDINQLWDVRHAIEVGKRIEDAGGLFWLEDPTAHDDYPGLARIADNLTMPIAAGEYCYGITPFRHLLEHRSVDIVMVDTLRAGGVTHWLKIAGMAEAFNMPLVTHLIPEMNVQLMACIPNALTIEYYPWTECLFEEVPPIVEGQLTVPTKPGWGLTFDEAFLKAHQVS
jgi:L-alanine-DL-glutamate epimerase-like enolase superfamily enzyme